MNTKQLLSLTLLATALTLNAGVPKQYILSTKQKANSLSSTLANILYKRGIEKDKAVEITKGFINENEELFTLMLNNLLNNSVLSQEKVLTQLSTMALQRKNIDLSSYGSLVKLAQQLSNTPLDKEQLNNLALISEKNCSLKKVFA